VLLSLAPSPLPDRRARLTAHLVVTGTGQLFLFSFFLFSFSFLLFIYFFLIYFLTGLWYLCLLALTLHNTFRLKNFFSFFSSSSFVVDRKNNCFSKHYVTDICNEGAACFLGTKSTISNIVYATSLCRGLLIQRDILSVH